MTSRKDDKQNNGCYSGELPETLLVSGSLQLRSTTMDDIPERIHYGDDGKIDRVVMSSMSRQPVRKASRKTIVPIFRKGDTPPELNGFDRLNSTARDMIERVKSLISKNDNDIDSDSNTSGPKI